MDKGKPDALNEDIMVKKDGNKWDLDKGHKEKWVRSEANRLYESRDDDVKGLLVNLYVMASEKENEYIEVRNKLRDTPAYYDKLSPALMTNLREQTKIKEEYVVFANKLIEKLSGDDPDLRGFWIDIGNKFLSGDELTKEDRERVLGKEEAPLPEPVSPPTLQGPPPPPSPGVVRPKEEIPRGPDDVPLPDFTESDV